MKTTYIHLSKVMSVTQLSSFFLIYMPTAPFYNYQKILQGICCAGVQRLLWWLKSFSLWTRESQSTHGLANPRMTHVMSYLIASTQSLHSARITSSQTLNYRWAERC